MTDPTTIRVDQYLAHPPPKVWRALTDSDLIARWLIEVRSAQTPGFSRGVGASTRDGQ
jgi:uncharacterized protein YndB with AHSA1/START domain